MMYVRLLAVWLVLGAVLSPAFAQATDDRDLARRVSQVLLGYAPMTIFDHVDARVENGMVALGGRVTMPYKKAELARRVALIAGVAGVRNDIGVLPASAMDDELRYRVARAIYGNPSFWTYAAMANPPIHIIVESGRVTLAGVVNNNVERTLARSLATGLGEVSIRNELKTDAEIRSRGLSGSPPPV